MAKTQSQSVAIAPPLPANLDAERSVLGAILLDNDAFDEASAFRLKVSDFYSEQHAAIFRAMGVLSDNSEKIDLVTLTDELSKKRNLEFVGGYAYIAKLMDGLPKTTNVQFYVNILRQKATLRRTIYVCDITQRLANESSESVDSIIDNALQGFLDLSEDLKGPNSLGKTARQAAQSAYADLDKSDDLRVFSGIVNLDRLTGGFRGGEMITITAGTGVGKSLLSQQIKRRACSDGFHGLYFSAEMTAEQLASREIAAEALVEQWKMRRPERMSSEDRQALLEVVRKECEFCTVIDGDLSAKQIRIASRRMKNVKWIVIDYDELIEAPGRDEWSQLRYVAKTAKNLSMTLKVPVFLISQLRKSLDAKEAKKPTLERIYGGAAKVKHSAFVLFIDREYVRELKGDETKARICVLKARFGGRVGEIPAYFNVKTLRFENVPEERGESNGSESND